jgi:hypothetical protein
MKKRHIIIVCSLIFVIYTCTSCTSNKKSKVTLVEEINVPEDYDKHLLADSLIESFEIIPLETNENCLISSIEQLLLFNNNFYISDKKSGSILVFDKTGKFIFKLNKLGKGPGEYTQLLDFKITEKGEILILDWLKIVRYDKEVNHIENFSLSNSRTNENGFAPNQFIPLSDNGYYFWTGSGGMKGELNLDHYAIKRFNKDGDIISKELPLSRSTLGYWNRFYKNLSGGYFVQSIEANDTIYSLNEDGLIGKYFVNFGKNSFPENYLPKRFNGMGKVYFETGKSTNYCSTIHNITESHDMLFFNFHSNNKTFEALYSKNSKKTLVGRTFTRPTAIGFQSFNQKTNEFISIMSDMSIALLQDERKDYEDEYSKTDKKLIEYIDSTQGKFSNPFLVTYKLKDF